MTTTTTRRGLFSEILAAFERDEDITQFQVYGRLYLHLPAGFTDADITLYDPDEIGRIRSALLQMYQRGMLVRVKKGRNLGNGRSECAIYRKA